VELKLRTARTLKVTEIRVTPEEQEFLSQLAMDPRYTALLDAMERGCIELETAHLNTSPGDPEAVLGGHCVAKAAWLFFIYVQKQVLNAYHTRTGPPEEEAQPAALDDILQGVG
jgi:hypothetical protein